MNNSHGFTMIEVLVAVVILSVGILGMAGLQGVALKQTANSQFYSQATKLAHDMAERMRANRATVLESADSYKVDPATQLTAPSVDCTTVTCTGQQLAAHDRYQWWLAVRALPSGNASVTVNMAARTADIRVLWDNERTGATGTNCPKPDEWDRKVDMTCLKLSVNL